MLAFLSRALRLLADLRSPGGLAFLPSQERTYRAVVQLRLPNAVMKEIAVRYPDIAEEKLSQVEGALRDFLDICAVTSSTFLIVPSRLVFSALQVFATTPEYAALCIAAYDEPLTLSPMIDAAGQRVDGERIWPTWYLACQQAGVEPEQPDRIPALFAIDECVGIHSPWRYRPSQVDATAAKDLEQARSGDPARSWLLQRYPRDFPRQAVAIGYFGPPGEKIKAWLGRDASGKPLPDIGGD